MVRNRLLFGIKGLLIDLDGVVYAGSQAIPGAAEFLVQARRRGLPFLLATNNSTRGPADVARRLSGMGIQVEAHEVLTSADAAAASARSVLRPGARVLVVGEVGLREAVTREGLHLAEPEDEGAIDGVVVGLDRAFDYGKLTAATRAIRAGARFIATNTDALLPVEGGDFLPGAGTMVAAIRTATGVEPAVAGKPEPALFRRGVQRLGQLAPEEVAMIGDRLDTDIEGAQRAGLRAVLVLSGVSRREEAEATGVRPDAVVADLAAVAGLLGWEGASDES